MFPNEINSCVFFGENAPLGVLMKGKISGILPKTNAQRFAATEQIKNKS